ncbi:MAG: hypothetical protein EBX41_06085 [Chitinophagia bacterium]|nr:hypothetical protein [Chitinophagia bacterium]
MNVQAVLDLNVGQTIKHTPKQNIPEIEGNPNNRAHASIIGDKTNEEVRIKLAYIASWALKED